MNTFHIQLQDIPPHKRPPCIDLTLPDTRVAQLTNTLETYKRTLSSASIEVTHLHDIVQKQTAEHIRVSAENYELRKALAAREKEAVAAATHNSRLMEQIKTTCEDNRRLRDALATLIDRESARMEEAVAKANRANELRENELMFQLNQVTQLYHASLLLSLSSERS